MKNGFMLVPKGKGGALKKIPRKIVSLVPSQTELLSALSLDKEVIGITKFCVHPRAWFLSKQHIGGTKKLHLSEIEKMVPDLVLANKEENTRPEIERLAKAFPVYVSDIETFDDALNMIADVGELTARNEEATLLREQIKKQFDDFKNNLTTSKVRTAYFIWKEPWMAVGAHTFINEIMKIAGLKNVFETGSRYPEFSLEELKNLEPEVILLSSEPYPFREKHQQEIQEIFPNCRVALADGEMFSWYGSRLLQTPDYLSRLLQTLV